MTLISTLHRQPARCAAPDTTPRQRTDFIGVLESHLACKDDELRRLRSENERMRAIDSDQELEIMEGSSRVCRGFMLAIEQPVEDHYPYGIAHVIETTWTSPNADSHVRSVYCAALSTPEEPTCSECLRLADNTALSALVRRSNHSSLHVTATKDAYLSFSQRALRAAHRRQLWRTNALQMLTHEGKLRHLSKISSAHERIVAALASGKLPRLHVLAQRLRRNGATPAAVATQFERAVDGFVPKGQFERTEYMKAFVLLKLGGRRALRLNQVDNGGPCRRQTLSQKLFQIPAHVSCAGTLQILSAVENLERNFAASPDHLALHHLAFDNINNDERLRYSTSIVGGGLRVARESSFEGALTIRSYSDVVRLTRALDDGELILAKETTVLCIIRNDRSASIIPVMSSGTAKVKGYKDGAADQAWMVTQILSLWHDKYAETHGPIACVPASVLWTAFSNQECSAKPCRTRFQSPRDERECFGRSRGV